MELARLKAGLDEAIDKTGFSGAVQVRRGHSVVYARAAGYADRSNAVANTTETRFGIASGTKFLTALAVGKLIDAGAFGLDTPVRECMPWKFPQYSNEVTIRQLLTHTSGIPDYYDEEQVSDFDNFRLAIPWSELARPRDYLPVLPDEPMKFAPGKRFSYSNSGYILLGVVVEEQAACEYREFVAREVFRAAGMEDSGFFAMNRLPARTALGYVAQKNGDWRTNVFDLPIVGASDGGAYATAGDIAKLWDALWSDRLLSAALTETFRTPHVEAASEGEHRHYGCGVWIRNAPDRTSEHFLTGCDAGVSFHSSVVRERELECTVLSNTTNGAWPIVRFWNECIGAELA